MITPLCPHSVQTSQYGPPDQPSESKARFRQVGCPGHVYALGYSPMFCLLIILPSVHTKLIYRLGSGRFFSQADKCTRWRVGRWCDRFTRSSKSIQSKVQPIAPPSSLVQQTMTLLWICPNQTVDPEPEILTCWAYSYSRYLNTSFRRHAALG